MKITGTNSYILLNLEGKILKASGEMIVGGFVADKSSMTHFEPPYENELLTANTKQIYIDTAIAKTKNSHMVITFV